MARSQNEVSKWSDMSTCVLKNPTSSSHQEINCFRHEITEKLRRKKNDLTIFRLFKNYSEKETFISAFSYKGRANYDLWWSVNTKHVNRAKYRPNGMIVQVVCEQST